MSQNQRLKRPTTVPAPVGRWDILRAVSSGWNGRPCAKEGDGSAVRFPFHYRVVPPVPPHRNPRRTNNGQEHPAGPPVSSRPIQFRPYQIEAMRAVIAAYREGITSALITLPTGAGKTVVFSELARRIMPRRTLIIAHREELLEQAAKKIAAIAGVEAGVEKGRRRSCPDDIVVTGSVQSLARGRKIPGEPFGLCVIDEAHHAAAQAYLTAVSRFAPRYVLGVTATPFRSDKLKLSHVFQKNVYTKPMLELIDEGYLTNIVIRTLPVKIDLSRLKPKDGDFDEIDLSAALDPMIEKLATIVASEYSDRKLLTFCPVRETSRRWTQALRDRGLAAAHVDGESPDRKAILDAYARDEIRFLSNASLLVEGYDEPSIDTLLILRPTTSRIMYSQMIGRGTRLFEGKNHLLVLDPIFLSERHNILSVADLVAEDESTSKAVDALMRDRGLDLQEAVAFNREMQRRHLAAALKAKADRTGYETSLAELCLNLDNPALKNWVPEFHWQSAPATPAQLNVIAKAGISPALAHCRGFASEIIDKLMIRRQLGKATIKQANFLRKAGFPNSEMLSFEAASSLIDEHRHNRRSKLYGGLSIKSALQSA